MLGSEHPYSNHSLGARQNSPGPKASTIGESVRKTGRVVIVEEGPKTGGVGAEIAAAIMERFVESLRATVARVASAEVPVPFSPVLEDADRPDVPRIVEATRMVVRS